MNTKSDGSPAAAMHQYVALDDKIFYINNAHLALKTLKLCILGGVCLFFYFYLRINRILF